MQPTDYADLTMVGFDLVNTKYIDPVENGGASPDFADVGVDEDISQSVDEIFGLDPDVEDDLIDPDFDAALQDFDDFLEAPVSIFP